MKNLYEILKENNLLSVEEYVNSQMDNLAGVWNISEIWEQGKPQEECYVFEKELRLLIQEIEGIKIDYSSENDIPYHVGRLEGFLEAYEQIYRNFLKNKPVQNINENRPWATVTHYFSNPTCGKIDLIKKEEK